MLSSSNIINRRLAIRIILFSTLITVFITLFQLYNDFKSDVGRINQQHDNIVSSFVHPLASNLWAFDEELVQSQIKGIASLPDITYVAVKTIHGDEWVEGVYGEKTVIEKIIPIEYERSNSQKVMLGSLVIRSNLRNVYIALFKKALIILLSNAVKTFFVAGFILYLVERMITKPLQKITESFCSATIERQFQPIELNRQDSYKNDEIDQVANAINAIWRDLKNSYDSLQESKIELTKAVRERDLLLEAELQFKESLEIKVEKRTHDLQQSMEKLDLTQKSMIEREKMASLGDVVAGLCHEINTPLGVCVTVASSLSNYNEDFKNILDEGALKKSDLDSYVYSIAEAENLLNTSLHSAAELMGHFKQVAVDQTSSHRRRFDLAEMLAEVLIIVKPAFKSEKYRLDLHCEKGIEMDSFPGPLNQVITNLLYNAKDHGFQNRETGNVKICAEVKKDSPDVTIKFSDDGSGIAEKNMDKVFNPFFTTKPGRGGTGLGLNITYNIVTSILGGEITVHSREGQGATFIITIPRHAPINAELIHEE